MKRIFFLIALQNDTKVVKVMESGGLWYYIDVITGYDPRVQNINNTLSFSAYGTIDAKAVAITSHSKLISFVVDEIKGGNNNKKIEIVLKEDLV